MNFNNRIIEKALSSPNGTKYFWLRAKHNSQYFSKSSFPTDNEIISILKEQAEVFRFQLHAVPTSRFLFPSIIQVPYAVPEIMVEVK